MKEIKIALLGSGTVGSGVLEVLKCNAEDIARRSGARILVEKVLIRDANKARPHLSAYKTTTDIEDILKDDSISIVVELMGGVTPAKDYMLRALKAGKHVVTANKDVIAAHGEELFAAAKENHADILFEASVGGGIPIITPLKTSLAGNKITEIMGIVNGTTNYMLTKMTEDGSSYDEVLKEAQEKGYAEANPTADVDGLDAARKVMILSSIAFNTKIDFDDVPVEGIRHITPKDIAYAKELGYVIKLLAIGRDLGEQGLDIRVHPVFLPKAHPLASVNDVFNAIFVRGNAIGEAMFYGRGAGSLPTASSVVADIVEVARDICADVFGRHTRIRTEAKKLCPLAETKSSYYVRLLVSDQPGVLGAIATAFGEQGVSLKSVIQTRREKDRAEIVAVTHCVRHAKLQAAAGVLQSLPVVTEIRSMIRVENEQGGD
ncbi:homoserine dehydrogenase [Selenomonas sp. TAMA-11512]|uniref:homoserine dehydrogenase n=1 Tax=Selenomonas sp. TAMA-11512 TaxID=3095337 RepID=UPI003089ECFF|nr:homoserine dehydrogenase [Selenomonas sp. TAMA-11512]